MAFAPLRVQVAASGGSRMAAGRVWRRVAYGGGSLLEAGPGI